MTTIHPAWPGHDGVFRVLPPLPVQPNLHDCYIGPLCATGPQMTEHGRDCGHYSCMIVVNDACGACQILWQYELDGSYPPFTECPDHGFVRISADASGAGFAGGRIFHLELECGCSVHDESDDIRAAR